MLKFGLILVQTENKTMSKHFFYLILLAFFACKTPQEGAKSTSEKKNEKQEEARDFTKAEKIEEQVIPSDGITKNMDQSFAFIQAVDMPSSIKKGEAFNYLIRYQTENDCQQFGSLKKETVSGNTIIRVILKQTKDKNCEENIEVQRKTVPYIPKETGEHYFYFYQGDDLLISRKLIVVD